MKERIILAGDIGGTKTTLGLFKATTGPRKPVAEETFPSASYPGLEVMAKEFLTKAGKDIEAACFGVAGSNGMRAVNRGSDRCNDEHGNK